MRPDRHHAPQAGGLTLDLFLVTPETWGVQLALRTGPAMFSRRLVSERRQTVGQIAALIYLRRWIHRGLMTPAEIMRFTRLTAEIGRLYAQRGQLQQRAEALEHEWRNVMQQVLVLDKDIAEAEARLVATIKGGSPDGQAQCAAAPGDAEAPQTGSGAEATVTEAAQPRDAAEQERLEQRRRAAAAQQSQVVIAGGPGGHRGMTGGFGARRPRIQKIRE